MKEFLWKGYKWVAKTHNKHNDNNYIYSYFSEKAVRYDNDKIELFVVKEPMDFIGSDDNFDSIVRRKTYGMGEVLGYCQEFSYGTFIWKAKMPKGSNIWPALWITANHSWPPEIDAMEAYPKKNCSYIDNIFKTNLETNIHYRTKNGNKNVGAKGICTLTYLLHKKNIDEWKIVWTPDYIKIYWNGVKIRKVTKKQNPKLFDDFNKEHAMYPIMNMMSLKDFNDDDFNKSPILTIYDFKYIPLNKTN